MTWSNHPRFCKGDTVVVKRGLPTVCVSDYNGPRIFLSEHDPDSRVYPRRHFEGRLCKVTGCLTDKEGHVVYYLRDMAEFPCYYPFTEDELSRSPISDDAFQRVIEESGVGFN